MIGTVKDEDMIMGVRETVRRFRDVEFPGDSVSTEEMRRLFPATTVCPISRQGCSHLAGIDNVDERTVYMFSTCDTPKYAQCKGAQVLFEEGGQN